MKKGLGDLYMHFVSLHREQQGREKKKLDKNIEGGTLKKKNSIETSFFG